METKGLEGGGCLQALSALAMTRMYYDGSMDDRSALIEEQRILDKSQGFLKKRQVLAALMEMKIGGMKGTPIALPRGAQGNALKRLVSQTPRAAAKEQLLEAKVEMRASLRSGESKLRSEAEDRKGKIQRIAAVSRSARTLLTDGTDVSVNLFFTSFAKQARRSRKGGFTGCANVISPIPVTT